MWDCGICAVAIQVRWLSPAQTTHAVVCQHVYLCLNDIIMSNEDSWPLRHIHLLWWSVDQCHKESKHWRYTCSPRVAFWPDWRTTMPVNAALMNCAQCILSRTPLSIICGWTKKPFMGGPGFDIFCLMGFINITWQLSHMVLPSISYMLVFACEWYLSRLHICVLRVCMISDTKLCIRLVWCLCIKICV